MYESKIKWNFPSARGIQRESINDPGIETFKDHPLNSLAREICQNSLDAQKDVNKPVEVTFDKFSIDTNTFPEIDTFRSNHDKAEQTWNNNIQALEYIKNAKKILNNSRINFLKISDYNTKGLIGAESNKLGSPWSTLVKEVGSSNKSDTSGGSFGIGKFAPFANSDIRTVFYSTNIPTGKYYIGVSKFMSFDMDDNSTTIGVGYYSQTEDSYAIKGKIPIYDDNRQDNFGTDIYIAGFNRGDNWKDEVIKSIINNFFITIWKGKLTVKVDNNTININKENLEEFVNLYGNEDTKIYYEVLTNKDTKILDVVVASRDMGMPYGKEFDYYEKEAKLYLLKTEKGNRKILMTRSIGMWLFEQKNISASIFFAGILMIEGDKMNSDFKKMENPAHNEWSPERYLENPKKAKQMYDRLRKFNRQAVINLFQEEVGDEMDAIGMNDFLPDNVTENNGSEKETENFITDLKKSIINKKEFTTESFVNEIPEETADDNIQELVKIAGGITDGDSGGGLNSDTKGNSKGCSEPGEGFGDLGVCDADGDEIFNIFLDTKGKTVSIIHKIAYINQKNEYQLILKPASNYKNIIIEVTTIGEVSKGKAKIKSATLNGKKLNTKNNMISVRELTKNEIANIRCTIDFDRIARIGVKFNEVKK